MAREKMRDGRIGWAKRRGDILQTGRTSPRVMGSDDIRLLLTHVPRMRLDELKTVIRRCGEPEYLSFQREAMTACLRRILRYNDDTSDKEPRAEQVTAMCQLVFESTDVLLIARTGFGKSLIFQAFSILTGRTTIQIIPMSRLGIQQHASIQRLAGTKPVLITADNKRRNKSLLNEVGHGSFTHVLCGPEQAVSKEFRAALRKPEFIGNIGLIAIDEAHFIRQWGTQFRPDFQAIGELRQLLPQDVVTFACTGTAGPDTEQAIRQFSGLREVGGGLYRTSVIRTSLDRENIKLIRCKIQRRMGGSAAKGYRLLLFLLSGYCGQSNESTPEQIAKTIIFVDSRSKVGEIAAYLRRVLLSLTQRAVPDNQYHCNQLSADKLNVYNVVSEYHAGIAEYDQNLRYAEYSKPSSSIRIMVATTLLGTGIDVPDIIRVVIWNIPLDATSEELWQRVGRGARDTRLDGFAFIFLPYWLFDDEGCIRDSNEEQGRDARPGPRTQSLSQSLSQSQSQYLPVHSSMLRHQQSLCDEGSDIDSIASTEYSVDSNDSNAPRASRSAPDGRLYWTPQDLARRSKFGDEWLHLANAQCMRFAILSRCGDRTNICATGERCCNGKSHPSSSDEAIIVPSFDLPEETTQRITKPSRPRSKVAHVMIEEWLRSVADDVWGEPQARFSMPADAVMLPATQWELAQLYLKRTKIVFKASMTIEDVIKVVQTLRDWDLLDQYGAELVRFLYNIHADVSRRADIMEERARERRKRDKGRISTRYNDGVGAVDSLQEGESEFDSGEVQRARRFAGIVVSIQRTIGEMDTSVSPGIKNWADRLQLDRLPEPPPPGTPQPLVAVFDEMVRFQQGSVLDKDTAVALFKSRGRRNPATPQGGHRLPGKVLASTPSVPPSQIGSTSTINTEPSTPSVQVRKRRMPLGEISSNPRQGKRVVRLTSKMQDYQAGYT